MVYRYLSLLSSHLSGMTVEARQGEIVTSRLDIEKVSPIVLESSREISRLATDRRMFSSARPRMTCLDGASSGLTSRLSLLDI